jgi:hypothetical protein
MAFSTDCADGDSTVINGCDVSSGKTTGRTVGRGSGARSAEAVLRSRSRETDGVIFDVI